MDHTEELEQATVRLDQVIWLASELANFDATSDIFREFCEYMPDEHEHLLFTALPCLSRFSSDVPDPEDVITELYNAGVKGGFIFQAAHPVKTWHSAKTSSYSWGYYHTAWLYAADLDRVVVTAVAWAEDIDAKEKTKQLNLPA